MACSKFARSAKAACRGPEVRRSSQDGRCWGSCRVRFTKEARLNLRTNQASPPIATEKPSQEALRQKMEADLKGPLPGWLGAPFASTLRLATSDSTVCSTARIRVPQRLAPISR